MLVRADLTAFIEWLARAITDSDGQIQKSICMGTEDAPDEGVPVLERDRLELLERVRPAGDALRTLGAREVILFGSILRQGLFDRASDIDILVAGLPDDLVLRAIDTVERATTIWEREINLVFDEMASAELFQEARRTGLPL
jgi:predicted nucleotidyltransferase